MHEPPDSTDGRADTGPEPQAGPQAGRPALRYDCELGRLGAPLAERFMRLHCDDDAHDFLRTAGAAPHGLLRTTAYRALRHVMSDFDAYGLLGMYRVHLLSTAQLRALLQLPDGQRVGRWLDVGAGNGAAIAAARPLLRSLHVTETSRVQRRRLAAQGAAVHDVDLCERPIDADGGGYDVVSLFNVLDRCLYPRTMLQHAVAALRPGGAVLVSLALPLRPHVDVGGHTVDQEQPLPMDDDDPAWEAAATRLWQDFIAPVTAPARLSLSSLSRVPYISQGDAHSALHVLDDALFVCGPVV